MKTLRLNTLALSIAAIYGFAACGSDDHSQSDHDHDDQNGHIHHDEDSDDHDHDEDGDDHDHDKIVAGPNGGRVLTSIEPHAEFFVTADRKVQIAFLDDAIKAIPPGEQLVTVIAGDRTNPTRLAFERVGDTLLSDKELPAGNDFPVVVQIKTTPTADIIREKFNLDLSECPTCEFKEYACTCEHEHDEE